jgi:hypothetical protein
MQCILYKICFWKVFHMYYNLICIFLYALLFARSFILVKSGCYNSSVSSSQNINAPFFMLGWDRYGFNKKCVGTRFIEHVFCIQWDLWVT